MNSITLNILKVFRVYFFKFLICSYHSISYDVWLQISSFSNWRINRERFSNLIIQPFIRLCSITTAVGRASLNNLRINQCVQTQGYEETVLHCPVVFTLGSCVLWANMDDSHGFHKHISFVMKLVNPILLVPVEFFTFLYTFNHNFSWGIFRCKQPIIIFISVLNFFNDGFNLKGSILFLYPQTTLLLHCPF